MLGGRLEPFRSVVLRLALADETVIAPALDQITASYAGQIAVGSYPVSQLSACMCTCMTCSHAGCMHGAAEHSHDLSFHRPAGLLVCSCQALAGCLLGPSQRSDVPGGYMQVSFLHNTLDLLLVKRSHVVPPF